MQSADDMTLSDRESDPEAGESGRERGWEREHNLDNYHRFSQSLPTMKTYGSRGYQQYGTLSEVEYASHTEDEQNDEDDFGDGTPSRTKALRTGRQRKRLAARTIKGSEFRQRRRKRRVYFCCISSEIDVPRMMDHLIDGNSEVFKGWNFRLYSDVLHLYKYASYSTSTSNTNPAGKSAGGGAESRLSIPGPLALPDPRRPRTTGTLVHDDEGEGEEDEDSLEQAETPVVHSVTTARGATRSGRGTGTGSGGGGYSYYANRVPVYPRGYGGFDAPSSPSPPLAVNATTGTNTNTNSSSNNSSSNTNSSSVHASSTEKTKDKFDRVESSSPNDNSMKEEEEYYFDPRDHEHEHEDSFDQDGSPSAAAAATVHGGTGARGRGGTGGGEGTNRSSSSSSSSSSEFHISHPGAQEIFVFDFGAIVMWGVPRGHEETVVLRAVRQFVNKGMVGFEEFVYGEDDMAYITTSSIESSSSFSSSSSSGSSRVSVVNDLIQLPENSAPKQRLAVSYAMAQSSVLSIFEARIEKKVEEYKYIPEALAANGKVHLTELQLGMMIGEVFVIRHDVNLHTEILDTPDFFWQEEHYRDVYDLMMSYLEMTGRTEILNVRLDMLRELLDVLQQQMESSHSTKLEWIIIWLIVAEVVLQGLKALGY